MAQPPETKRATPYLLWAFGVLSIFAVGFAIRMLTRERVSVRAAQVSYQALIKTSSTNGKVEPVQEFQSYAQTAGVIEKIYVEVGEKVKAGQLLLKMGDAGTEARLASAQSSLDAARKAEGDITHGGTQDERNASESDLNLARMQQRQDAASLAALQQLQQKGAAAPAEIAAARARLDADANKIHFLEQHGAQRYGDSDRAGAMAKISTALAGVADAQSNFVGANIRTPIAGTVYSIPYSQYDYVHPGDDPALIYVADLDRLRVLAYFDEPDVGNLVVGQPVTIVWEAKRGMVWHGHISVAPTSIITYNTRNVGECYITVDDAHGDLEPNANVTVTVTTAQHAHVLTVPHEAVYTDSDGAQSYVFRILHGRLVRTNVRIGIVNLVREEILSGLAEGDLVALRATSTNHDLTDGLQITVVR